MSETATWPQRLVEKVAGRRGPGRRGFLGGSALVGAALASAPWTYLTRPASAYDAVCGSHPDCSDGYTVFCCTINNGRNSCPPNSFVAGWWKADRSNFCGGSARYYIDCNAFRNDAWKCRCNSASGTCDRRRVACNQFRYGQCNTQVPYSNTGPVVCRVVSCTPPWQQYKGVCSSSSRTDNATASHAAPCLSANVQGRLDATSVDRDIVRLRGWALSPDDPAKPVRIAVTFDPHAPTDPLVAVMTNRLRQDVNTAFSTTGYHGYDVSVIVPGGRRVLRVYAWAPGSSVPVLIGATTVAVPVDRAPVGRLDALTTSGNTVRVTGWAYDPDRPSASVGVHVYAGNTLVTTGTADRGRADVNRAYRITGAHGYDLTATLRNGPTQVKVYAINAGPGARNPLLAVRTIDVNPGAMPVGRLDAVSAQGEQVLLSGWAYDPDRPDDELDVAVFEDGKPIGWFPTGILRSDVNAAYGITGKHGYAVRIGSTPGAHTWTVYAINVGGGRGNPLIGTRTGRVGDTGGIGVLDEFTAAPSGTPGTTRVRLRGWAFDQRATTTEVPMSVSVDGAPGVEFPTGLPRPDVEAEYGITGDHGFDLSVDVPDGGHVITVFAVTSTGPALIATRKTT